MAGTIQEKSLWLKASIIFDQVIFNSNLRFIMYCLLGPGKSQIYWKVFHWRVVDLIMF